MCRSDKHRALFGELHKNTRTVHLTNNLLTFAYSDPQNSQQVNIQLLFQCEIAFYCNYIGRITLIRIVHIARELLWLSVVEYVE